VPVPSPPVRIFIELSERGLDQAGKRVASLGRPCVEPYRDDPFLLAGDKCSLELEHEGALAHSPVRVDPQCEGRLTTRCHDEVRKARYLACDAQDVLIIKSFKRLVVEENELTVYGGITHGPPAHRRNAGPAPRVSGGTGPTARVLDNPEHPCTQRLRASVPRPGWKPSNSL
jgi:hypothetical protein